MVFNHPRCKTKDTQGTKVSFRQCVGHAAAHILLLLGILGRKAAPMCIITKGQPGQRRSAARIVDLYIMRSQGLCLNEAVFQCETLQLVM